MKDPCIYFFDSTGSLPPKQVENLIDDLIDKGKKNSIDFEYYYNDEEHQKGTTECGIYCIHFTIYMLKGGKFNEYINKDLADKFIEKFRSIYFI